jgi:hypothetical protein
MTANSIEIGVLNRKNGDTGRMLKRIKEGEISLSELSSNQLDQQETFYFLARELHFLGRVATTAGIPSLQVLLEELHFALLQKMSR